MTCWKHDDYVNFMGCNITLFSILFFKRSQESRYNNKTCYERSKCYTNLQHRRFSIDFVQFCSDACNVHNLNKTKISISFQQNCGSDGDPLIHPSRVTLINFVHFFFSVISNHCHFPLTRL